MRREEGYGGVEVSPPSAAVYQPSCVRWGKLTISHAVPLAVSEVLRACSNHSAMVDVLPFLPYKGGIVCLAFPRCCGSDQSAAFGIRKEFFSLGKIDKVSGRFLYLPCCILEGWLQGVRTEI